MVLVPSNISGMMWNIGLYFASCLEIPLRTGHKPTQSCVEDKGQTFKNPELSVFRKWIYIIIKQGIKKKKLYWILLNILFFVGGRVLKLYLHICFYILPDLASFL